MMRIKLHYLKIVLLLSLGVLYSTGSRAQCTSSINFESSTSSVHASTSDPTPTATSFTHIGKTFNITSQTSGQVFFVDGTYPSDGYGWNGTSADNIYISNNGYATSGTGLQFTIGTSDASLFAVKSFWLQITDAAVTNPVSATVTITGKIGSTTVFTVTKSTGWVSSFGTNNGFNLIDLSTLGGVNNSNLLIDKFTITTSSTAPYMQLDAITLSNKYPTTVTSAATSVTGTSATLNGTINANSFATTSNIFQYSTSSTLASGVTSLNATPSTVSGSSATAVSASISGLTTGATYYYRVRSTNCGGTSDGSIMSFVASAGTPLTATQSQTNVTCNGGTDGTATVTASGGTAPYGYSWAPSGGSAATATGLSAGTYTCTITDAASGSINKTFTITQPAVLSVSGTASFCATTTLTGSISGGTWSSSNTSVATVGSSSGVVTGIVGGTAVISYNHTCGVATATVTVGLPTPGSISGLTSVCMTAFIAHSSTGTAGGTWVSSNTAVGTINTSTGTMGGASAGTTTISYTVTNSCGSATATIVNTVYALTDGGAISGPSSVCVGSNMTLTSSSTSISSPPYTHAWSSSATAIATVNATTGVVQGISPGTSRITYSVTGCGLVRTFYTVNVLPTSVSAITGTTTVVAGSTTTLSSTTSGGTWSSTNTAVGTVDASGVVTGIAVGTTTISYVISNACGTVAATANVTVTSPLTATQSQTNVTCNGGTDGTATVTPSGGTSPYGYSWAPSGGSAATATGLSAGSYTCTITDAASASIAKTFTITEPSAVTVTGTGTVCPIGTRTLTPSVTGGTWSSSNTAIATVGSTGVVTGVAGGTATITYTTSCGDVTTIVTVNAGPNPGTVVGNAFGCVTAFISHSASGGTAGGVWSSSNPAVGTINASNGLFADLTAGTTIVSYTVTNGCGTASDTMLTTVYALSDPGAISGPSTVCSGNTIAMSNSTTTTGFPYTYAWSSSATAVATVNATTGVVTGLSAGTSRISYTISGCGLFRTFYTVNVLVTPTVAAITGTTTTDDASSTLLSDVTSGGVWSSTNTAVGTVDASGNVTGISPGTTTISYTITNSCGTAVATTNVTVISSFSVTQSQTNVSCFGLSNGTASVTASGGTPPYGYSWTPSVSTTATATGLAAGTYTCVVTDDASNSVTKVFTITQPTLLTASLVSQTNVSCFGLSNGAATVSASGGTSGEPTPPSYSYSWAPSGGTSATATGLAAGTYTCTVTDGHSCTTTQIVTITEPSAITASVSSQTNVSCFGGNTGAATISASGGTGTLMYSWAPSGGTDATATGLAAGTYTCTITDANSCTSTQTVTITQPSALAITSTASSSPVCAGSTLNLTSGVTGGVTPYTYSWNGPSAYTSTNANPSIASVTAGAAGTYSLSVTDNNGCTASGTHTVSVTINPRPVLSSLGNNGPICSTFNLNLTSSVVSGMTPYTYSWSGPNSFTSTVQNPTIASAITAATGTYTLNVTDANGCTLASPGTTAATVNPRPTLSSIGNNSPVCSGNTLSFSSSASGGTGTLTYAWAGPGPFTSTASNPSIASALTVNTGTFTLTVTDGVGCHASGTNTIAATVNARPVVSSISNNGPVCYGNTLSLMNTTTGGTTPYGYSWSGPDGFSSTAANPSISSATTSATGVYTLVVTDNNGCSPTSASTTAATVNPLPATITGNGNICIGLTTTLSNATGTGSWSSSDPTTASVDGSGVVTGNVLGTATISYTLSTGCYMTKEVTVNAFPSAITGPTSICAGANITMGDATSGGTWSSGNTTIATIDASTGIATGLAAGTVVFSYTSNVGCTVASAPVTNMVSAITGTGGTCLGLTMTFTDATTGGTWSSSNPAVGSINSTTGAFASMTGGSTTVTYTVGSCYRVLPVTVATAPPDITGNTEICIGGTTPLSNEAVGGTWTRWASTSIVTNVTYTGGVVTGVNAGTSVITYALSHSCFTTIVITVDPTPVITGSMTLCNGTSGTLASSISGGTWMSNSPSIVSIDASGNVTAHAVGSAHITYMPSTGCYKEVLVTVISGPAPITGTNSLCTGSTATFTDATSGGTGWSSSTPSVATVGSLSGVVTGVSYGTATITYNVISGCVSTKVVTVTPLPDVITGTATVCSGETTTLTSAPAGGTWSASSAVATVDASGVVTGATSGTVTIDYSIGAGCSRTKVVTVNALPATIGGPTTVCIGSVATFTNTTTGGTWSSSNATAATINASTGVMSALASGTTTVSYTLGTGCARTATVTVNSITASTGNVPVCQGQTITLSNATTGGTWVSSNTTIATVNSSTGVVTGVSAGNASISYVLGSGCATIAEVTVNSSPATISGTMNVNVGTTTTLSDATTGGTWSSSNTAKATVDAGTGVVTGVDTGVVTITYTVGGCYRTTNVTVNAALPPFTGPTTLCVGSSVILIPPVYGVSWESSNTSVATIGSISGVVYGVSPGTTTITFTFVGGAKTTQVMTVYALPAAISGSSLVCQGATTTLSDASSGGAWSSSNTVAATIGSSTGVVTGAFGGSSVITYTLNGCIATKTITVGAIPAPITGQPTICVGTPVPFSDATTGCVWSSSSTSIATVGTTAAGANVTGVAPGIVTISYTYASTGCGRTYDVTVNDMTPNTGSANACTGATNTLSNASTGGAWTSSNLGVATVGAATGIVSGMTVGTARITYTYTSTCKAFTVVTVSASPAAISGATGVCPGATTTLTDGTTGGTWSSANTTIASVDPTTGVVSGVVSGTTTISYTVANGCSKTIAMTVRPVPSAISGSGTVCTGVTSVYTDASGAGAWSSGSTAVGTIGASSGVLMPLTAGTTNITFTLTSTGCKATKIVTVNTAGTVSGPVTVSKAASILSPIPYTDAVSGGTWSTSNVARATIGSGTGLLTGVSAGTVTVSYSANGCVATLPITITTPREVGNGPTGIESVTTLELFPNPTNGTFTVRASAAGTFGVYTLEGKEAQVFNITEGDNVISMPNTLAAGVYLCRFVGANGDITTIRLVYQP